MHIQEKMRVATGKNLMQVRAPMDVRVKDQSVSNGRRTKSRIVVDCIVRRLPLTADFQ